MRPRSVRGAVRNRQESDDLGNGCTNCRDFVGGFGQRLHGSVLMSGSTTAMFARQTKGQFFCVAGV